MIRAWMLVAIACFVGRATAADSGRGEFTCLPGFDVELVYAVPLATQGSWVKMTSDDRGRLITSDEHGGLFRVTPGRTADETRVEAIEQDIGEAQGLLFARDALYVVVSNSGRHPSGLYRLRYEEADDSFGKPELLHPFRGRGERGPHGIALGPDGLLYVVGGYHAAYPTLEGPLSPFITTATRTLFRPLVDRVDPAPPDAPSCGGWVARTDPHGKRWELWCSGMQNPYDLAFDEDGELFTYDSDMEWDLGTSWYRPTRVLHLRSGGDYGWRPGSAKHSPSSLDSLPAAVEIGRGSPTGLAFGHRAAFPEPYRRALFVGDWTHGRIYAVHLEPDGASYRGRFEVFVGRKPMPVTDVKVHSDGSLYFLVGGRKTQSGVYRVKFVPGAGGTAPAEPDGVRAGTGDSPKADSPRLTRRNLESLHRRDAGTSALDLAWNHLGHPDRHVRYAARVAVQHHDSAAWRERTFAEASPAATLEAVTALVQVASGEPGGALLDRVLDRLNRIPLDQLNPTDMAGLVRVYALALIHLGGPTPPPALTSGGLKARLEAIRRTEVLDDDAEAVELQAFLGDAAGVASGVDRLCEAGTQERQVAYAASLRQAIHLLPADSQRTYFTWLNVAEEQYSGGERFRTFIGMIRNDAARQLSADARSQWAELIDGGAIPANRIRKSTRMFVHNWQYDFLAERLEAIRQGRSFEQGKTAFVEASCAACHQFQGTGGDVGPDLTLVGRRFSREYILESILFPDKFVSDRYGRALVVDRDGRSWEGRIVDRDADTLEIKVGPHARGTVRVPAASVAEIRPAGSDMPAGLLNVLTQAEIYDLIAYLLSEGDESDPCFSP